MDLVRELKDVRFELSLRGYDCEAVDAFLAKLRGDITSVQDENESAVARIRELEQAVQDGGGASSETEGTLRRTLVLAQRLADETEAEAKKDAAEMLHSATAEAEQMRSAAEIESQSMKEEGKRELDNARDEAATIRETVAEEAARTRGEARVESEAVLAEAERRGLERVATLEQAAQVEAAAMREPIRQEVVELEGARARVMSDIAALESHLEQQRVRVRTAVEALRVGMSGSIEDLERVADDDELLATQEAPETTGARAADVGVAPDIDIVDSVTMNAPLAPTVDDIEHGARAAVATDAEGSAPYEEADPDSAAEDGAIDDGTVDDIAVGDGAVDDIAHDDGGADIPQVEIVDAQVVEAADADGLDFDLDGGDLLENAEAEVAEPFDLGPATEPIPIIDALPADDAGGEIDGDIVDSTPEDLAAAVEVDELDDEPNVLFGTDLADDTDAELVDTSVPDGEITVDLEDSGVDDGAAGDSAVLVGDMTPPAGSDAPDEASSAQGGVSFVERFAELLDAQPIGRDQ